MIRASPVLRCPQRLRRGLLVADDRPVGPRAKRRRLSKSPWRSRQLPRWKRKLSVPVGDREKKVEPDQPATSKTRSKSRKMKDLDEMRQEIITPSTPIRALQSSLPTFTDSPRSAMMKLQRRLGYIASANNMSLAQESITKMVKPVQSTSFFGKLARKAGFVLLAALKFTLAFVMTIVLAVYLRWKFVYPLPYCDSGAMPKPFFPEVDLVTSLKTLCLTCPEHGHCSSGNLSAMRVISGNALGCGWGNLCPRLEADEQGRGSGQED